MAGGQGTSWIRVSRPTRDLAGLGLPGHIASFVTAACAVQQMQRYFAARRAFRVCHASPALRQSLGSLPSPTQG